MSRSEITKTVAARRLIAAAIQMLFRGDDSLAVHTVAMAAFRILRDLAKNRGLKHDLDLMIRPGMEKKVWGKLNNAANFLKHADRDPGEVLSLLPDEVNDTILMIACTYYELLGNRSTTEMRVLMVWYVSLHPDSLAEEAEPVMGDQFEAVSDTKSLPRSEQLAIGLTVLRRALGQT